MRQHRLIVAAAKGQPGQPVVPFGDVGIGLYQLAHQGDGPIRIRLLGQRFDAARHGGRRTLGPGDEGAEIRKRLIRSAQPHPENSHVQMGKVGFGAQFQPALRRPETDVGQVGLLGEFRGQLGQLRIFGYQRRFKIVRHRLAELLALPGDLRKQQVGIQVRARDRTPDR